MLVVNPYIYDLCCACCSWFLVYWYEHGCTGMFSSWCVLLRADSHLLVCVRACVDDDQASSGHYPEGNVFLWWRGESQQSDAASCCSGELYGRNAFSSICTLSLPLSWAVTQRDTSSLSTLACQTMTVAVFSVTSALSYQSRHKTVPSNAFSASSSTAIATKSCFVDLFYERCIALFAISLVNICS